MRRADLAAAQQLETLGEDVLELLDRTALEQHVPVRADRLLGLRLAARCRPCSVPRRRSAGTPRPRARRPRPTSGSRTRAPAGSAYADVLAGRELDPALVLEALAPESGSAQSALSHEPPPGLVSRRYPDGRAAMWLDPCVPPSATIGSARPGPTLVGCVAVVQRDPPNGDPSGRPQPAPAVRSDYPSAGSDHRGRRRCPPRGCRGPGPPGRSSTPPTTKNTISAKIAGR